MILSPGLLYIKENASFFFYSACKITDRLMNLVYMNIIHDKVWGFSPTGF